MGRSLIIAALAIALAGCTSQTEHGRCIGVMQEKDPKKEYELSVWNTVMAVVFSETIIVPVVVIANQYQCPVGERK